MVSGKGFPSLVVAMAQSWAERGSQATRSKAQEEGARRLSHEA